MQKWVRTPEFEALYGYINEYQRLVYEYYSNHGIAFLTTYYHINTDETIWEDEYVFGGAYEQVGDLTGIKRDKILLLPIYFPEEITTAFDGQEIGQVKENITSIVFPSSYGITPLPHDIIKLEQTFLRQSNDTYPTFQVTGVEIHPNTDKRYWKLRLEVFQSRLTTEVDEQVINTHVFFDYDKKIHTLDDSEFLTKLLAKNSTLRSTLKNLFDENSGFYLL